MPIFHLKKQKQNITTQGVTRVPSRMVTEKPKIKSKSSGSKAHVLSTLPYDFFQPSYFSSLSPLSLRKPRAATGT